MKENRAFAGVICGDMCDFRAVLEFLDEREQWEPAFQKRANICFTALTFKLLLPFYY